MSRSEELVDHLIDNLANLGDLVDFSSVSVDEVVEVRNSGQLVKVWLGRVELLHPLAVLVEFQLHGIRLGLGGVIVVLEF